MLLLKPLCMRIFSQVQWKMKLSLIQIINLFLKQDGSLIKFMAHTHWALFKKARFAFNRFCDSICTLTYCKI